MNTALGGQPFRGPGMPSSHFKMTTPKSEEDHSVPQAVRCKDAESLYQDMARRGSSRRLLPRSQPHVALVFASACPAYQIPMSVGRKFGPTCPPRLTIYITPLYNAKAWARTTLQSPPVPHWTEARPNARPAPSRAASHADCARRLVRTESLADALAMRRGAPNMRNMQPPRTGVFGIRSQET